MIDWILQRDVVTALALFSTLALVGSLVLVPWFVGRLPADYLLPAADRKPSSVPERKPAARFALAALRNAAGALLVVIGVAMLVLPGQGLATILVGLLVMDFPGKRGLVRRLLSAGPVLSGLNSIRRRTGKPPLVLPP